MELIGVIDESVAANTELGSWVKRHVSGGERLLGCCMRSSDFDGVARRLGLEPVAGGRARSDRSRLTFRTIGLDDTVREGLP